MAVYGFIGEKGSGKSYAVCRRMVRAHDDKQRTHCNLTSTWDWCSRVTCLADICAIRGGVCWWDEAPQWVGARDYRNTPPELLSSFAQGRKDGCHLLYTAQFWQQTDLHLREQTDVVYKCSRYGGYIILERFDPKVWDGGRAVGKQAAKRIGMEFERIRPEMRRWYNTNEIVPFRQVTRDGKEFYTGGRIGASDEKMLAEKRAKLIEQNALIEAPWRGDGWRWLRATDDDLKLADRVIVWDGDKDAWQAVEPYQFRSLDNDALEILRIQRGNGAAPALAPSAPLPPPFESGGSGPYAAGGVR